jgi:hypothetical protein
MSSVETPHCAYARPLNNYFDLIRKFYANELISGRISVTTAPQSKREA